VKKCLKFLDFEILQVSDLTREFDREQITVWGNRSSEIVEKCYRQVSVLK
jgi:hypothetical protein